LVLPHAHPIYYFLVFTLLTAGSGLVANLRHFLLFKSFLQLQPIFASFYNKYHFFYK